MYYYVTGMTSDSQEKLRMFSLYNDYDLPRLWFDELISIVSFQRTHQSVGPVGFSGFSEGSIGPPLISPSQSEPCSTT